MTAADFPSKLLLYASWHVPEYLTAALPVPHRKSSQPIMMGGCHVKDGGTTPGAPLGQTLTPWDKTIDGGSFTQIDACGRKGTSSPIGSRGVLWRSQDRRAQAWRKGGALVVWRGSIEVWTPPWQTRCTKILLFQPFTGSTLIEERKRPVLLH